MRSFNFGEASGFKLIIYWCIIWSSLLYSYHKARVSFHVIIHILWFVFVPVHVTRYVSTKDQRGLHIYTHMTHHTNNLLVVICVSSLESGTKELGTSLSVGLNILDKRQEIVHVPVEKNVFLFIYHHHIFLVGC